MLCYIAKRLRGVENTKQLVSSQSQNSSFWTVLKFRVKECAILCLLWVLLFEIYYIVISIIWCEYIQRAINQIFFLKFDIIRVCLYIYMSYLVFCWINICETTKWHNTEISLFVNVRLFHSIYIRLLWS